MKWQPRRTARHARSGWSLGVMLMLGWWIGTATTAGFASSAFVPEPEAVFEGAAAAPWDRVERLHDPHPQFGTDRFAPGGRQKDPLIVRWFGSATPHSAAVLLHCAPGWQGRTLPRPVLLVHGAGDNANRAWIHPFQPPRHPTELPPKDERGFATWLSELGYAVFAVTFAHNQGCNLRQSEQLANAITRIRRLLQRENDPNFAIDIIAHSKGNIAARLYCSDAATLFPDRKWLTPFRGDVRTYVAIAAPLQGIDTPFRYYGYNLARAVQPDAEANVPMAAQGMLIYGLWRSFAHESYEGQGHELWPGQAQVLYNLARDGGVPLTTDSATVTDANLSMNALYHGGTSLFISSKGIDSAIARGERLMYRLEERGLDPRVRLAILAGDEPVISNGYKTYWENLQFLYLGLFMKTWSHPSDGIILLATATNTRGILRRKARLIGQKVVHRNHLDLARDPSLIQTIDAWLLQKPLALAAAR